jgi:hypothetical protein
MYSKFKRNKRLVTVAVLREVAMKEVPEMDMVMVVDEDMEEGEVDPPLFFNYGEIGHVSKFCTKLHTLYWYY